MNLEKFKDFQIAILGLALALGLMVSTAIAANTMLSAKKYPDEVISVTGSAAKDIQADYAEWSGDFERRSGSMADAYNALNRDQARIKAFLLTLGASETEISFNSVNSQTLYQRDDRGNTTDVVTGYALSQTVNVESRDVAKITKIAQKSADLISEGLYFTPGAPSYFYTKLDDLKVEMLGSATKNAYERARSMAKSTGRGVGMLRRADMGVFQITAKNSTEVSDYGINDTSSRDKKVTAVVNATFTMN